MQSIHDITVFPLLVNSPWCISKYHRIWITRKKKKKREFMLPLLQILHSAYAAGGIWLSDNLAQMKGMNGTSFHSPPPSPPVIMKFRIVERRRKKALGLRWVKKEKEHFSLRKMKNPFRTLEASLSVAFRGFYWILHIYYMLLSTVYSLWPWLFFLWGSYPKGLKDTVLTVSTNRLITGSRAVGIFSPDILFQFRKKISIIKLKANI